MAWLVCLGLQANVGTEMELEEGGHGGKRSADEDSSGICERKTSSFEGPGKEGLRGGPTNILCSILFKRPCHHSHLSPWKKKSWVKVAGTEKYCALV